MSQDGRRARSKRRRGRPLSDMERAQRILRDLRHLANDIEQRAVGDGAEAGPERQLWLPLPVELGPPDRVRSQEAAKTLLSNLQQQVTDALRAQVSFASGHVYCFLCDAADCAHASPREAVETFRGYRPTGKPEWQGFANLCIERHDPRVDRLYGDNPEVIAIVQTANELTRGMMSGFGKESLAYRVLGQVAFGLFPKNLQLGSPEERVALTLQVVETRSGERSNSIQLNLLGLTMDEIAAAAGRTRGRGPAESLRRTIRTTRDRIASLARRARDARQRNAEIDLNEAVVPLLHKMKGDLERVFRPLRRRTRHAQERHQGGARPTSQALTDALAAPDTRVLWDDSRNTVVVLGPKGRAHIYSEAGRLVTSLQLRAGEVDRKTERGRWKPMARADVAAFRDALR